MIERPAIVLDEHLLFLDDLRESGQTNMFGAVPYLKYAFGLDKKKAKIVLVYWMESFSERHNNESKD